MPASSETSLQVKMIAGIGGFECRVINVMYAFSPQQGIHSLSYRRGLSMRSYTIRRSSFGRSRKRKERGAIDKTLMDAIGSVPVPRKSCPSDFMDLCRVRGDVVKLTSKVAV
jgi:hypothetical protein